MPLNRAIATETHTRFSTIDGLSHMLPMKGVSIREQRRTMQVKASRCVRLRPESCLFLREALADHTHRRLGHHIEPFDLDVSAAVLANAE
jgi:hypothetical protein